MANLQGTNIASLIVPFTEDDTFPTHNSKYGKGGFREVATIAERDSIPLGRRNEGMLVYVIENDTIYQLKGGVSNYFWVQFSLTTTNYINIIVNQITSGHKIITSTGYYADNTNLNHFNKVLGLTLSSAVSGESVNVQNQDTLTEVSWNWNANEVLFLSTNGNMTQTVPTTGFLQELGIALTSTKILLDIKEPIKL